MQRVNEFVFYELAVKVHKLAEIPDGTSLKFSAIWPEWWQAREAVSEIFRQRPLNFAGPTASRLFNALTEVVPQDLNQVVAKFTPTGQEEPDIPYMAVFEIREAAKEFETVLRNECLLMDSYFVTKKGAYATVDLVQNAHHQVPEPSRSRLPDQAKLDFDQAGKCMAFDVATASAFHLLRGTEAVIREYYDLIVPGEKKAKPNMRNWGTYIRLLESHGADKNIISLLRLMKDVYRNPVMHPEETYTDEQAQVLFGMCISAVVLIETEIHRLTEKGGTLQFPATGALALGDTA